MSKGLRATIGAALVATFAALFTPSPAAAETFRFDITIHAPASVEATGPDGAVVSYNISGVPALPQVNAWMDVFCQPLSGSVLPIGTNRIRCVGHRSFPVAPGQRDDVYFSRADAVVEVTDTTPPHLGQGIDVTLEATGPTGAAATFAVPAATDIVDQDVDVTCIPAPGSPLPFGATTVSCTAIDDYTNQAATSMTVRVVDSTAPTLTLPTGISATATGPDGAVVDFDATARDLVAGVVPTTCSPASGSTFPLGDTVVTCTASDAGAATAGWRSRPRQTDGGNVATGTFVVSVRPEQVTPTTQLTTTTTAPVTTTTPVWPTTTTVAPAMPVVAVLPATR